LYFDIASSENGSNVEYSSYDTGDGGPDTSTWKISLSSNNRIPFGVC